MKPIVKLLAWVMVFRWWVYSKYSWWHHQRIQGKVKHNLEVTIKKLEQLDSEEQKYHRAQEKASEIIQRREAETQEIKTVYLKRIQSYVAALPENNSLFVDPLSTNMGIDLNTYKGTDLKKDVQKAADKFILQNGPIPKKGAK